MESRVGLENKEKGHNKEKRTVVFWVLTGTLQKHTVLLLHMILTFSFSINTKDRYSLLSFFPSFFFQLLTYTIHIAPHNSTVFALF